MESAVGAEALMQNGPRSWAVSGSRVGEPCREADVGHDVFLRLYQRPE